MKSPSAHTYLKSTLFFHKDKGYDTEDYYVLKKEIKRLIAKGYLHQFLKKDFFPRAE
jgi:hypothetical protein